MFGRMMLDSFLLIFFQRYESVSIWHDRVARNAIHSFGPFLFYYVNEDSNCTLVVKLNWGGTVAVLRRGIASLALIKT